MMPVFSPSLTYQLDTSSSAIIKKQLTDIASENYAYPSDENEVFHVFKDYDPLLREIDPVEIELQHEYDSNVQNASRENASNINPVVS